MYIRLILLFLFLLVYDLHAIKISRSIDSVSVVGDLQRLEVDAGQKLKCPVELRLPMLIALSQYPELRWCSIKVEFTSLKTTATSRPSTQFLFKWHNFAKDTLRHHCNRTYVIRINNKSCFEGVLMKDVPFNAKIGVLGHELAHIADYERRGTFRVLKRASDYLSKRRKRTFEREIDSITIVHGLGWQLYDWADFVLNKSTAVAQYKMFKKTTYMLPEEIIVKLQSEKTHVETF